MCTLGSMQIKFLFREMCQIDLPRVAQNRSVVEMGSKLINKIEIK